MEDVTCKNIVISLVLGVKSSGLEVRGYIMREGVRGHQPVGNPYGQ